MEGRRTTVGARRTLVAVAAVLAAAAGVASPAPAAGLVPTTVQVSVSARGGGTPRPAGFPSVSDDGRYVAFESDARNIVPDDGNGVSDVFVRDMVAGSTIRANVAADGTEADAGALLTGARPDIDGTGRFVAFASKAANLAEGDGNRLQDVYVRDLALATTTRVSVAADGGDPDGVSYAPDVSDGGRYVAFVSEASNLVPGDGNGDHDVFVRDLVAGTTVRASVDVDGGDPDVPYDVTWTTAVPAISGNGRYVAFSSMGSDIVAGDGNGNVDVFVRDLLTGTTTRVSVDHEGGDADGWSEQPAISDSGRHVAFSSSAEDLLQYPAQHHRWNLFVRDLVAGRTTQLSVLDGRTPNRSSQYPAISDDGRMVAFTTGVPYALGDEWIDETQDVYMADAVTGEITHVSATADGGFACWSCNSAAIDGTGRRVAFASGGDMVTTPEDDDGLASDVFLRTTR